MEQVTTRTAKLIPRPRKVKKVPGFATSYHFETDKHLEDERGNLYIVIEVLTAGKQAETVVDLVIESVGNAYFNTEAKTDQDTLGRFEEAVKATNKALAGYTNEGNAGWVGRLSAVIAVLHQEQLHLTQAGSADAYLYRGNLSSHITADLQTKGIQKPGNTFSNIASGTVLPNDRLVMGTPALFHQLNRAALKSIVTDSTANGAIQKISERVGADDDADRIAAIVVEVTTAEMMAMSTIPEEPEEVHIGRPDSPLEVAKTVAAPAAMSAAIKSREVGHKVLHQARTNVLPKVRQGALVGAGWLRQALKQQRTRQILAVALVLIIVFSLWRSNTASSTKMINAGVSQYISSFQEYQAAVELTETDKVTAQSKLDNASKLLDELSKHKKRKDIEAQLAKRGRETNDPSSIEGLKQLISTQVDTLNGIVSAQATVVSDLSGLANNPAYLELVGSTYVVADRDGSIITYSASKPASIAASKPEGFGSLVATTASSNNDGVYLLTDEPAVWFFNLNSNELTKQTAGLDGWVKGKAIASYSGNLYVLADDASQVWRFLKTTGGFGAKTAYFNGVDISGSTAIAIDGSIYLSSASGIRRYTRSILDMSPTGLPDSLKNPAILSVAGSTLVTLDGTSNRIGIFNGPDNTINYSKQIALKDVGTINSVKIDVNATTIYVLADKKLLSTPLTK